MNDSAGNPLAKVTKTRNLNTDRFLCTEVYRLWEDDQVTIDRYIEDMEWGGVEESRKTGKKQDFPSGFFKPGFKRKIAQSGATQEEPL